LGLEVRFNFSEDSYTLMIGSKEQRVCKLGKTRCFEAR